MLRLPRLLIAMFLIIPHLAYAQTANIMMLPTRIYLENNKRSETIILKNVGDAPGDYTVDLVDMKMTEDGAVVDYDHGEHPQYSAIPYLRIAPKSMTLKPGESQTVRIIVRKPEDLEDGEYRAHVRVFRAHQNTTAPNVLAKEPQITVRTNLAVTVPVIMRTGKTSLTMTIDAPKLSYDDKIGPPNLDIDLTREGNRSSMGDFTVTCSQNGGAPRKIKFFPGVAVYRPLNRRHVSIPLDETPKDVNLAQCKLGIIYTAQQHDGGQKLAETVFDPGSNR